MRLERTRPVDARQYKNYSARERSRFMRIAILIPWFLPNRGGAEIGAWELARRLVQKGHLVRVITPRYRLDWKAEETIDGIEVRRYRSLAPSRWRRFSEIAHCLQAFPGVFHALNDFQPDLLHLHYMLWTGYAGMAWARRAGKPVVLSLVGNDVYDPYYTPCGYLRFLNRWMIRQSQETVAASSFVRDKINELFEPSKPIPIIPYGVSLERFHPAGQAAKEAARRRLGLPLDRSIVLTVQRLHERKGVHYYLDAAAKALHELPNTLFVIVGGGPERVRLEQHAQKLGIASQVRFTGRVEDEDLPHYYEACDLFAFHTLHEGFGIVLLEAMATGRAVVTTRAGGTLDIVLDGVNGLMLAPRDATGLAGAMVTLLKDPQRRQAMEAANPLRVEQFFNWDRIAEQYELAYKTPEEIAC